MKNLLNKLKNLFKREPWKVYGLKEGKPYRIKGTKRQIMHRETGDWQTVYDPLELWSKR